MRAWESSFAKEAVMERKYRLEYPKEERRIFWKPFFNNDDSDENGFWKSNMGRYVEVTHAYHGNNIYNIDQCTAPGNLKISKDEYRKDIKRLRMFVEGKK